MELSAQMFEIYGHCIPKQLSQEIALKAIRTKMNDELKPDDDQDMNFCDFF